MSARKIRAKDTIYINVNKFYSRVFVTKQEIEQGTVARKGEILVESLNNHWKNSIDQIYYIDPESVNKYFEEVK